MSLPGAVESLPAVASPTPDARHRRWRPLTIRTRLALSYSMVMAAVLVVLTIAVGGVHERLGLARIDADLASAMHSVAGVVDSEIDERFDLAIGAHEALIELELPGTGVAILDAHGRTLATRAPGVMALPPSRLTGGVAGAAAQTLEPERVRIAASDWRASRHRRPDLLSSRGVEHG